MATSSGGTEVPAAMEQQHLLLEPSSASSPSSPTARAAAGCRGRRTALAALGLGFIAAAASACFLTVNNIATNSGGGHSGVDVGSNYDEDRVAVPASGLEALSMKFRFPQLWPAQARPECRERLDRLESLHAEKVKLVPGGTHDVDFPPNMDSIGHMDMCGDTAQGIREDCSKYNHWVPMQEVAKRYYQKFSIFKPGGIDYHDIGQGQLGSCYFLGALASIAKVAPQIIEEMFVRRELWKDNIFTTKWLIDEQETFIEVDGMLPASEDNVAHFVQPSSTGEFWPSILEKAWAKIHTSFSAIEGGYWPMPVMAITRAPVRTSYHKVGFKAHLRHMLSLFIYKSKDELWDQMVEATSLNRPMGANTASKEARCEKYGLANYHIYSVFRAYESHDYGKVVEVYNPWNSDNYHGTIPNPDKDDGLFTMTFDEYFDAFHSTYFAEVIPHYQSTATRIQHGQESKWSHHNFQVSNIPDGSSFFVSLNWPAHRMVKPCPMLNPDVTFQVVKADSHGEPISEVFEGKRDGKIVNSLSAEVTSGAGSYHILTTAKFREANFVDDLYLSVYAPEKVTITEVAGIADGDRFKYQPWGSHCVAHWVNGELWVRSEAVTSTDGAKIFKTQDGAGADLVDGKLVEVQWENSRTVKAQMDDNGGIEIHDGGDVSHFERLSPDPIPGSEDWWSCRHKHMYLCGVSCCCDSSKWSDSEEECRPI